jgi:hypothetical protein
MQSRRGSDEWQFTAHPSFGLKLTGPGEPRMPRPTQLGLSWLRLSRAEQARRRQAFFAALLRPWTSRTTFHARGLGDDTAARLTWFDGVEAAEQGADRAGGRGPLRRVNGTGRAPAVVSGPLTGDTLDVLLDSDARSIVVRRDGRPLLATRDGWLAAVVHLTEDEEDRTRERLREVEAERVAAQAAGTDRRGRALAYLAFYYVLLALAVLVGWLSLRQLGDAFPNALAVALGVAVGVTFFSLLSPLQRLVTHWYGPG